MSDSVSLATVNYVEFGVPWPVCRNPDITGRRHLPIDFSLTTSAYDNACRMQAVVGVDRISSVAPEHHLLVEVCQVGGSTPAQKLGSLVPIERECAVCEMLRLAANIEQFGCFD